MMAVLELFKDALGRWWLETGFLRKIGDLIVAMMALVMLAVGAYYYENRAGIQRQINAHLGVVVLDHDMAKREASEFLASVAARGVLAVAIMEVDVEASRRGVIAYASTQQLEPLMRRLAVEYRDVPLIGENYTVAENRKLTEGRYFWSPGVTVPYLRLVAPIPPIAGESPRGMLVILCDPSLSNPNRDVIESRALVWAKRLAGL